MAALIDAKFIMVDDTLHGGGTGKSTSAEFGHDGGDNVEWTAMSVTQLKEQSTPTHRLGGQRRAVALK